MKKNFSKGRGSALALTAALIFATTTFTSCNGATAKNKKAEEEVETLFAVNVQKMTPGNLDDYLEFGGDVESSSSVSVYPDMAGKISSIQINVGDMVSRDQVLAYVDASRPGMSYSASPVKAPISGRVTSFSPSVGTMVSQSVGIAQIAKTDELEIKISIAERFVSRIANGQSAVARFDAYPGVDFAAKVVEVSPVLDTTTRTMTAKLKLDPVDPRIKVGMYAKIRLVTESKQNAIVVPSTAIVTREGKPYVFIVSQQKTDKEPARVKLTAITQGITVDNKTEISQGISAGDLLIVKGQALLNDGSGVNILNVAE